MSDEMTKDERLLARILFANRLLKATNQAFQQLFWAVKGARHGQEFVKVRPQGRKGDGGNDGYLPADGHYFQLYGPIDPNEKVAVAVKKLAEDFDKLKASWDHTNKILAYTFAYNDKYEGTFPDIAKALEEIGKANQGVTCRVFTASHLEDEFLSLPPGKLDEIIGLLPDPTRIVQIDYSVLRDVVAHIMNSPSKAVTTRFGDLPELGEKIRLNNLCSAWGDVIRKGARQSGHVDNYFSKNSNFLKQALRDHLVEIYQRVRDAGRALQTIPDGINREDLIFDDFRRALLPGNATISAEAAVEILIGYYFEACDIFDPHADKESPSASA